MKFLVLLTPNTNATREAFEPYRVPEQVHVWANYRKGHLRDFYYQAQPTVITLIYEMDTVEAVNAELDSLPMIVAGLLDRQVVHMGPWLPLEAMFDKTLATH